MIARTVGRTVGWAAVALLCAPMAGCNPETTIEPAAGGTTAPTVFFQRNWEPQEVPHAHVVRSDYRVRPGDFLEIIYHVRHQRSEEYKLKIQDQILLRFPFHPDLNQTEQVNSDGTLRLALVGKLEVLGKTIDEVQDELTAAYAKFIKNPALTLTFKESNVKINELKKAIITAPRGQSRLVPVTPDGRISLPLIVDVRAAGLTISELYRELNEAYREIGLDELEVTVNLQQVAPLRVYVLGEVRRPGVVMNRSGTDSDLTELTLLQAISEAGGYVPARAEMSRVALIRRRNLPKPQCAVVNVHQLLENQSRLAGKPVVADSSKYRFDIWLADGDVIYVPTTEIAKRADYIDYVWTRGIRAVGGFTSTANYTVGDAVDWLGPNP